MEITNFKATKYILRCKMYLDGSMYLDASMYLNASVYLRKGAITTSIPETSKEETRNK